MGEATNLGDTVEGYIDGSHDTRDEFPESLSNRGAAYRHGWLNGRDDRRGKPRAGADALREQHREALEKDGLPPLPAATVDRER